MVLLNSKLAIATYVAFITSVSASPIQQRSDAVHSVKITKPANKLSAKDLLSKERDRIDSFVIAATTGNAPAINGDINYLITVEVGGYDFNLMIVDTSSSNIWVGAGVPYTGSGRCNGTFSVSDGDSGFVNGPECVDKVTVGGLTVPRQSFGSASGNIEYSGTDGVFGIGPVDLTKGTVSNMKTVPTFLDNLYSQGTISTEVLGIYFEPESGSDDDDRNGELTFGGVDHTKFIGTPTYFAKSKVSPYSHYWGIHVASITYGSKLLSSSSAIAVVDTGMTLIYIPTSAYNNFLTATGGITDPLSGSAVFGTEPTGTMTFTFGSTGYALTPSQYIIPSAQNEYFGLLGAPYYYSWISDGGSVAADVNFVIGQKFLENYYSVLDTTNSRIGFATRT